MKKITSVLTALTICCFLAAAPTASYAQDRSTTTQAEDNDNDMDYGWIGLLGLAGLLGLRKRDDRDVRPGNRV